MSITIPVAAGDNLDQLAHAVYKALVAADCPDLASKALVVRSQSRDGSEYLAAVLKLSDELRVEWQMAGPK